jgi:MFS family permease
MGDVQRTNDGEGVPLQRHWLWRPNLIVFMSSACIMILELVAGRIIAPHVGSSLYTWTSIIGVVLAGISLGNYVGGWMADRWASPRLLGRVFMLSGLASIGILFVNRFNLVPAGPWPLMVKSLLLITVLFFPPAVVLGTVSPIVAKLAMHDLEKTGQTVGQLYAYGSMGSIIGTFATGFFLVFLFNTHVIIWGLGGFLLLIGVLFYRMPGIQEPI